MFTLEPKQLKRIELVNELAALLSGDGEINDLLSAAGYVPTERACELAAQSVIVTFEAHALGKLSASALIAANGHNGHKPRTAKTGKASKAGNGMANCPHCGLEFKERGLTRHANACSENPANAENESD